VTYPQSYLLEAAGRKFNMSGFYVLNQSLIKWIVDKDRQRTKSSRAFGPIVLAQVARVTLLPKPETLPQTPFRAASRVGFKNTSACVGTTLVYETILKTRSTHFQLKDTIFKSFTHTKSFPITITIFTTKNFNTTQMALRTLANHGFKDRNLYKFLKILDYNTNQRVIR
jgi:hypothetical protein